MTAVADRISEPALGRLGRALADESRRRILIELSEGPAHPAELARRLGLGKANTSNHLTCLRGCGLVVARPEGRRVRYELADERLADGLRLLAAVVVSIDPACGLATTRPASVGVDSAGLPMELAR